MPAALLDGLAKRISQQETELKALRRELETRRTQLADLTQRREGLLTQLQRIDAEIATVASGSVATVATPPAGGSKAKPRRAKVARKAKRSPSQQATARGADKLSLPNLILSIFKAASEPLTIRELVRQVKRRGFVSTSRHFDKMVESRTYELRLKGLVTRPEGQKGFVLAGGSKLAPAASRPVNQRTPAAPQNGKPLAKLVKPRRSAKRGKAAPLQDVITSILTKNREPIGARELARQALAAGYKTKSKNFTDVIWVALGKMGTVENVQGKGWRLKRAK